MPQAMAFPLTAPDWGLFSLTPFTTDETLTVAMENGDSFTVAVTDTWVVESTNLLAPSILAARWDELVVDILVPTAVCYLILIGSYRHDKRRIAALKEERIKSNTPIV